MIVRALLLAAAFPLPSPATDAALAKAPREIGVFLERRAECEHWGGEEPYDKARLAEITRAVRKLRCDRLEAEQRALLRKYAGRPAVVRLLEAETD